MAHQAHNLPWHTLSSNFNFIYTNRRYHGKTNLYPLHKPGQGKQLTHFAKVFTQTLEDFSRCERAKYPDEYEPAEPEEVVITPATVKKIQSTVQKYRSTNWRWQRKHLCGARPPSWNCTCPLSLDDRRMSLWINYLNCRCCSFTEIHNDTVELAKTLLLHNEMDVLLRIASHPDVHLEERWSFPWDTTRDWGWSELVRSTLMGYICLNVFYLKPETYDLAFRRTHVETGTQRGGQLPTPEEEMDYRRTSAYQKMLFRCTSERHFDTYTYPHRQFFGVPQGMYPGYYQWYEADAFGLTSLSRLRARPEGASVYLPTRSDIPIVISYLGKEGLPPELSLQVLEFAEYVPQRRLVVADDPLNVENGEELREYLNYCWQLLVRSDMLAKACGKRINWVGEVTECIWELWGVGYPKMIERTYQYEQEEEDELEGAWGRCCVSAFV